MIVKTYKNQELIFQNDVTSNMSRLYEYPKETFTILTSLPVPEDEFPKYEIHIQREGRDTLWVLDIKTPGVVNQTPYGILKEIGWEEQEINFRVIKSRNPHIPIKINMSPGKNKNMHDFDWYFNFEQYLASNGLNRVTSVEFDFFLVEGELIPRIKNVTLIPIKGLDDTDYLFNAKKYAWYYLFAKSKKSILYRLGVNQWGYKRA